MSLVGRDDRRAWSLLLDLYVFASRTRRRELMITLGLMLFATLAELLTIGAVLPLLLVATGAKASPPIFRHLLSHIGDSGQPVKLVVIIGVISTAAVSAAFLRMAVARFGHRFAFGLGHDISSAIFGRTLRQRFSFYVGRNPSEIFAGLDKIQALIFTVLTPLLQAVVATTITAAIFVLLLSIAPLLTLIAAGAVALLYAVIARFSKHRLRANSQIVSAMVTARLKALQEAHGGLRDILLEQAQDIFEEKYRRIDGRLRQAQSNSLFLIAAPRFVLEASGIVLIGLFALYANGRPGGIVAAIPLLGAFALAAQRLMPLLNNAYVGWSQFQGNWQLMHDILDLLATPIVGGRGKASPLAFATDIVFDQVSLRYPGRELALGDVSLRIPKGSWVGITGPSGSGKSSLLDLLMGIAEPTGGEIRIDGIRLDESVRDGWQATLAHVPQSIYLADASIAANIAFGRAEAEIDMDRIRAVAARTRLAEFIDGLADGYETVVGDRGIRLSGGQRQRISLARALYKGASVLVLDEATGQLDRAVEREILDSLRASGERLTVILVAHQTSALTGVDQIFYLEGGKLVQAPE